MPGSRVEHQMGAEVISREYGSSNNVYASYERAGLVVGEWSYQYDVGFAGDGLIVWKSRFHTLEEVPTDFQGPTTPRARVRRHSR